MMVILIETMGLLLAFLLTILAFVWKDRKGGLHWYPTHVQEAAVERGLTTIEILTQRQKHSKLLGSALCLAVLLGSVFGLNGVRDWSTAFWQMTIMMLILNWSDAYFVDYVWVRKTNYWHIPELADIHDIAKPVQQILKERVVSSLMCICFAALLACLVFLF